jgi:hypothetical protein
MVLPLLMVTLAACGSDTDATSAVDSTDSYCSTLKRAGWQVLTHDPMAMDDVTEFAALRTNLNELGSSAPVEVKAAWGVLGDDFVGYAAAMEEAGISVDELLYMDDNGKLPPSVDRKHFAQFVRGLDALDRSKIDKATDTIVAHAKAECGINVDPDPD